MAVADYNTDPDLNTTISGINIAEGCPPSGINNAIRQMMADIKDEADSLDANVVKLSGNQTVGGTKTFSNGVVSALSSSLRRDVNDSYAIIYGGTGWGNGAHISLYGKDSVSYTGTFTIRAHDGTNYKDLNGTPDGTLTWDGKDIITNGGNQTVGGVKTFSSSPVVPTPASSSDTTVPATTEWVNDYACMLSGNQTIAGVKTFSSSPVVPTPASNSDTTVPATTEWVNDYAVMLSGNQPIDGVKTFTGSPIIKNSSPYVNFVDTDWQKGTAPSSNQFEGLHFYDKNSVSGGAIDYSYTTDKDSKVTVIAYNMISSSASGNTSVIVSYSPSGVKLFYPSSNGDVQLGGGSHRWQQLYAATTTISTSDERQKTSISAIPDAVLDAWGDVQWSQFQFKDAVAEKGEAARLHSGLIAQRIDDAFKAHGLDASRYGLFCHDEWDAKPEERDSDGNIITPAIEAGDAYSLRYEEALCMEAAYQRRRADRAEARITALEQRLEEMEQAIAALAGGAE